MTQVHDSGSDKAPSFGAFIDETPSSSKSSNDNKTQPGDDEGGSPRRRRGTRGGRGRRARAEEDSESQVASTTTSAEAGSADPGSADPGSADPGSATEASDDSSTRKKRSRRGRRGGAKRSRKDSDEPGAEAEGSSAEGSAAESSAAEPSAAEDRPAPARKKRARRSRRARSETEPETEPEEERAEGASADGESSTEERPARSRRKRTRRTRSTESQDDVDGDGGEPSAGESEDGEGTKKRRRRGSRGGRKRQKRDEDELGDSRRPAAAVVEVIPGEDDDLPELPELPEEAELLGEGGSSKKKRKRSRRKKSTRGGGDFEGEAEEAEAPKRRSTKKKEVVPDRQILVNASDHEETRVAVVKNQRILDFQMNVESDKSLVNDIYRGRVVNLEESIGAAFIDFGRGRNGFLHTSDVLPAYGDKDWDLSKLLSTRIDAEEWDENSSQPHIADELGEDEEDGASGAAAEEKSEKSGKEAKGGKKGRGGKHRRARPRKPIKEMLKVGDRVVVQVTKDAIGDKGPTLTTYISIPGRYHVLMPSTDHRGVSRKIEDARERRRLKKILDGLEIPSGMGLIARTAAKGCTKVDLMRDLEYLLDAWDKLSRKVVKGHGPVALYQESDVAIRTVRDLFGPETESVIVDEEETFHRVKEFAELLMPEHVERIRLHEGDRPLFHSAGIEQEFERIFSRRIELPSGGSVVFDQAEALVAIDVNSGKTRTSSHDFEEIALKTNMEAVPEIARQIRLRDLGGIIVVDFIDMMKNSNRRNVEKAFRAELTSDRARSKVGRISQFGLLEMTRQRLGPGMSKKLFTNCPHCRGLGRVRTAASRAASILRRLGSAMTLKGFSQVEVRAHPDAIRHLQKEHRQDLEELEKKHNRKLKFTDVADQVEDSVLRYLRADGREVRPGGRRKR